MRLLFIKLKNIGDALIMTPALTVAREIFPDAQIDVLVRGGTEGILKGSLAINHIYTSAAPETNKRSSAQFFKDVALISKLRKKKYDWVFELSDNNRGRVMAVMIGGKNRATHIVKKFPAWALPLFNKKQPEPVPSPHRCGKDVDLLRAFCGYTGPTPPLQFDRSFADWSWTQAHITQAPIVVHAVTRWKRKMWPVEKWKELVKRVSEVAPVVLTSGANAEEVAMTREIASAAPNRTILTEGKLNWAQMAGLLYSSRMMVCVDTATMHLGAACQTPMVALLGPTLEEQWRPWACKHELIVPPLPPSKNPQERRLDGVSVNEVWQACERIFSATSAKK